MERNIYLELTPPAEALAAWLQAIDDTCEAPGSETIPLFMSAGRVTAEAIAAKRSSPAFHGAAMDGFAVFAPDTYSASTRKPLALAIGEQAWPVNTGQPLPKSANAVVMIEEINYDAEKKSIVIEKPAYPWQHVRKAGEDIVATEVILPPGSCIGAQEIGALAAGGALQLPVCKRARVAIIPTGDDLVPVELADETALAMGKQLPEFNSHVLTAMLNAAGADSRTLPIAPDDPDAILAAIRSAEGVDLILINAGTSAGSRDFSAHVIATSGKIIAHGIAMMPGKPTVLGILNVAGRKLPVAAIPGYPVSAWLAMNEFVLPLLAHWQKRAIPQPGIIQAAPVNPLPSRPGMEEKLRVKLGVVDGAAWAVPLPRGAGTVTSLSRADALLTIPADSEGLDACAPVPATLLRPRNEIEGALLAIGSHDNTLDLLDSLLRRNHPAFRLTSAHVGSLGGLLALARGQAHLAGSHLLDPETGIYNQTAIREYLPDVPVALVRLADREQGLIVLPQNPLAIKGFADLTRDDARFINRQKGSGTRVLLDWELKRSGIDATKINGYRDEEYTHMNVAQAVLSGRADAGLGVRAAANALGLDFVPVGFEQYDLVIPLKYMGDERMQALLAIIRSQEFKTAVNGLGGYDTGRTGEIIAEFQGS
ncbi:MAG: molybdopterin biosynthesis protein [Desulfovibrio sp.]|nr:molybdopterin biosynthesis protein [Desulfovibrio sp.]